MKKYTTQQGDTFDLIAYKTLGSCNYTEQVINANREHVRTFIFSAGVSINIPDIDEEIKATPRPPWKR